jgi:hypothetical protein
MITRFSLMKPLHLIFHLLGWGDAIVFVGAHENGQVQIQCEMVGGEIGLQVLGVPSAKQCRSG